MSKSLGEISSENVGTADQRGITEPKALSLTSDLSGSI